MPERKSKNPAYPDADPTAPGGMSKANLRIELKERHGLGMDETRDMSWPDLIQATVEGRLLEQKGNDDRRSRLVTDGVEFEDGPDLDAEDMFGDLFEDLDEDLSAQRDSDLAAFAAPQAGDEVIDPETFFETMLSEREGALADAPPPLFLGIPGTRDYVFDGHAGAGPSASERWMNCTMSLAASRDFLKSLSPNQRRAFAHSNLAARQGTTAHSAGEALANLSLGRIEQDEYDAQILSLTLEPDEEGEAYDDEMAEYVGEYVDLIQSYAAERGADHVLIEQRVEAAIPLSDLHEDETYVIRGSADAVILPTPDDTELVVIDLKYGSGIWVDVEENTQEMIYALGVLDMLTDEDGVLITDVETVTLYIAQPRMGGLREWTISLDELYDWRDDVLSPALTRALYGEGATFEPSKTACQFCPARGRCPALAEKRIAEAAEAFDVIVEAEFEGEEFPETTTLSDERLGQLLAQIGGLTNIYSDLKEEAQRRLHRGGKVPGYLLVNYTPQRKWKDDALNKINAVKGLTAAERKSLVKEPALVTPTAAEKMLKDKYAKITDLVDKPAIRPVIAPEGDRRKPWGGVPPEQMFGDLPDEEA